jgi:uncharacterized membrane protein
MNEQTRSELERLKQRHSQLEQQLALLARELKLVESRLEVEAPEQSFVQGPIPQAPVTISGAAEGRETRPVQRIKLPDPGSRSPERPQTVASSAPPPIPPRIAPPPKAAPQTATPASSSVPGPDLRRSRLHVDLKTGKFFKGACNCCGGHIEFPEDAAGQALACPHCGESTVLKAAPAPIPVPRAVPRAPEPVPPPSFEMRLGTFWLVRIGIVMLLTALVFFGNYAYHNFIGMIGPAGKVSLLYLASALLLGAGAWWQRKAGQESLKNYAQVLFGGGLAAVYFTTYAAHHIETLRVIGSALLDGALLLAWAGFMVWIADRKKSEVLALFAVLLAYYTAAITRIGSFTLYSNLVLAVAAVFFLVRNRWAALSFASLVATYAAYAFWRFFNGIDWHWAAPEEELWHGAYFLACYWVIFTGAVFFSKHEKLSGPARATFLTMNNGGFFVLFLLTMCQAHQGGFWKFALGYGAVLLGLAELARRMPAQEPLTKNAYLTQGLLFTTLGVIIKFAGLKLALILGAESVVLLTLGCVRKSRILRIGAYVAGALAVGWGIDSLERNDVQGLWLGTALGAMMAFNAFWWHRQTAAKPAPFRPVPAFFSILALISWLGTTWYNTGAASFPLVLAFEALALTFSVYVLRVGELALLSQAYVLLAHGAWLWHFTQAGLVPPWWNPLLMIAITLVLSHWWQRQKVLGLETQLAWFWQGLYALAIVALTYHWLEPLAGAPAWLIWTSLLAVIITAYGVVTRAWLLAVCGQLFLLVSAGQFAMQLWTRKPDWYYALAPVAALGFFSVSTVKWFQRSPEGETSVRVPLLQVALIYRWTALLMSLWWVNEYVPARERIWVLALLGLLAFIWAGWRRNSEGLLFSAAFALTGIGMFWVPLHGASTVCWPNLLAILALLAEQRMARRWDDRYKLDLRAQGALIVLGGLSLWLFLYRWLCENASGFYLTASWSGLALVLFACGIVLRERMYRWVGLGILATALGRVFIFDVWKLETLYRILSFMALGVVLLVLGFIYNKYQEKIKEWL